ncbi:MAG: acyl-CoA synthetase [Planctomycetota bacterium]
MTATELVFQRANQFANRIAMLEGELEVTYDELANQSDDLAKFLLARNKEFNKRNDLGEQRVAFLLPAGRAYVVAQWGIWKAGGIAVPLSRSATEHELRYTLTDASVSILVADDAGLQKLNGLLGELSLDVFDIGDIGDQASEAASCELPTIGLDRRAMILYTSGTTSRPKGVVSTHANIRAQIKSLVEAWQWSLDDKIPLFLPLHHIHGIINVLSCALWSGACIEVYPKFDLPQILNRVRGNYFTLFMAVPTIYVKLIEALEQLQEADRKEVCAGFEGLRLMVSGSAALPASVHERWTELTGQLLLERYGMTEIGMALSNSYTGERRPGAVGDELPGVIVRLVDEAGNAIEDENQPGEIQVKGPCVFVEYWNQAVATKDSFDEGWFRTGDVAVLEKGYYRIMGRTSVDIIKSGGYKLSALEIEAFLLDHPSIRECAVVGLPDPTWGEIVAVVLVTRKHAKLDLETLTAWCADRLSSYEMPRRLLCVGELPRNAMGKITKPAVKELFR